MRPVRLALVAALAAVFCASCGGGPAAGGSPAPSPQPAGLAKLTILTPSSGQVIRGSTVLLRVRLVVTRAGSPAAAPAYLHVYIDNRISTIQPAVFASGVTEQAVHGLGPGRHQLRAEFVGPNHLPFRPPVAATVAVVVRR